MELTILATKISATECDESMKVKQTRNRCRDDLSVSVKIRIHDDWERRTVELCRRLEAAGVAYLTVHGRTKDQRAEAVNLDAIRAVKQVSKHLSWQIKHSSLPPSVILIN